VKVLVFFYLLENQVRRKKVEKKYGRKKSNLKNSDLSIITEYFHGS